ncbi:DnaJ domain-containing protein [Lachnospiraceae bacterium 50-23]|jgi:curved DNA-binding protein CbpA|nr:DnaJ domain-containing protein [Dorea sp.]GFI38084.1 chaperone protein DnaJ [Lachnospiraceae bacterium]
MDNKNYYDILGVSVKASAEEITAAKNTLAKQYHPDVNLKDGIDTTEQMQQILEAYHVLSDPARRADYDREITGRTAVMQTFDLHNMEETQVNNEEGFVVYWKASNELYDIILESDTLFGQKEAKSRLVTLAMQALKPIITLRDAQIPEKYWHPDIMNWLLFTSYKNKNFSTPYLLSLYDEHTKKTTSVMDRMKLQNRAMRYQHSVKKLMKY